MFCALVLLLGVMTVPAAALEGETQRSADILATLGLVQGTGSDYALDDNVTRAQAAVLLVRLAGAEQLAEKGSWGSGFRDMPAWASDAITYAAYQGWVTGVTTSDFKPNNSVTANAWFTMLLRMLGYSDKSGDFTVSDAAAFAQRVGLTTQSYDGAMTRGSVFQTMLDALTFSYRDGRGTVVSRLVERGACSRATANALGLLDAELTARQVADRHMAAVFALDTYASQKYIDAETPSGNSSGFFISADGLAVTNYHSIDGAIYATATLSNGETYPVERVIYYDAGIDIAVLKLSTTSTDNKTTSAFSYLELAGTEDIRPGDTVYTLGNPLGLGLAVSSGIISAVERVVDGYDLPCVMDTADISQGSSGGALLNTHGRVIAVTSGAYIYGNNMYLAVPVDPVLTADLTVEGWTLTEVAAIEKTKN
jgi:S1-C subfamily serine protease